MKPRMGAADIDGNDRFDHNSPAQNCIEARISISNAVSERKGH